MNSFGHIYRLTSFGESHGAAIGGVIDGLPAGVELSISKIQEALDRRRPGSSASVSPRREPDKLHLLSGLLLSDSDPDKAVTLGTPIGFYVENRDANQAAYDQLRNTSRPHHADATYQAKYGLRDWRGGGRASGRETISRVVAGAIAEQLLGIKGVNIISKVTRIGDCTDPAKFDEYIAGIKQEGDSIGGIVETSVTGLPAGLGEPVFGKLQQLLASAMLSIGAVHGFEYGDGFNLATTRGSAPYDDGGILGGISDGNPIRFRVAFKPTPTIAKLFPGRHDPCIAIRGCEVVRAMTAMVLLDVWLRNLSAKNF